MKGISPTLTLTFPWRVHNFDNRDKTNWFVKSLIPSKSPHILDTHIAENLYTLQRVMGNSIINCKVCLCSFLGIKKIWKDEDNYKNRWRYLIYVIVSGRKTFENYISLCLTFRLTLMCFLPGGRRGKTNWLAIRDPWGHTLSIIERGSDREHVAADWVIRTRSGPRCLTLWFHCQNHT